MIAFFTKMQTSALAALLMTAAALPAQVETIQAKQPQAPQPQLVSIDFRGGTLGAFLDYIRKTSEDINILASNMADDILLPPVTLRRATVESALRAVSRIAPADYIIEVNTMSDRAGVPVYSVGVRERSQQMGPGIMQQTSARAVRVFSLRAMTDKMPDDVSSSVIAPATILTAIETGLQIEGSKEAATVRYHKDSGLLFVNGTHAQGDIVSNVLKSMQRDLEQIRKAAQRTSRKRSAPAPKGPAKDQAR